jgi:diaminopimelate epimerase
MEKSIRNSREFKEKGINVNFVQSEDERIVVRTYERGVENETLSCGTGVTAAALVFAHNEQGFNHVDVETPGGRLAVEFDKENDRFTNVWLLGPATYVFKGEIELK